MTRVSFLIPGKPFAKQRPRATRQGRVYTPKETVSFERQVAQLAALHFPEPFTGPVAVRIVARFATPQSWSKKKAREALERRWHTQKPDLDNCAKAVLDALNRIAWADDGQVASLSVEKHWTDKTAETRVIVEALE